MMDSDLRQGQREDEKLLDQSTVKETEVPWVG